MAYNRPYDEDALPRYVFLLSPTRLPLPLKRPRIVHCGSAFAFNKRQFRKGVTMQHKANHSTHTDLLSPSPYVIHENRHYRLENHELTRYPLEARTI